MIQKLKNNTIKANKLKKVFKFNTIIINKYALDKSLQAYACIIFKCLSYKLKCLMVFIFHIFVSLTQDYN